MLLEVAPLVIVPPLRDHEYVAPVCAGTLAATAVEPAVTWLGAVMVATGAAYTDTTALPEAVWLAAVVTVTLTVVEGVAVAVKVRVAVPWPAVIVPPLIDQAKLAPACAGTLAVRPAVAIVVRVVDRVMAAFAGDATHVEPDSWYPLLHVYVQAPLAGAQVPLPFETVQLTLGCPPQLPLPSQTSGLVQALLSLHAVPAAATSQCHCGMSILQVGA
jgi:hypothetical protein